MQEKYDVMEKTRYVIVVAKVPEDYDQDFIGQYVDFRGGLTKDLNQAKVYNSRQDAADDCEKWGKLSYGEEKYDVVDYDEC